MSYKILKNCSFSQVLFCVGLFFSLYSCSDYKDARTYYFPLNDLQDGLVYEYDGVEDDSLPPIYWYYRSFVYPDSLFLTGLRYSPDIFPEQFIREELISNGMILLDSYVYETDSLGDQQEISVDIKSPVVFPFELKDSTQVYLYNVYWESILNPGLALEVVKNRFYRGDTTITYDGKEYDAIILGVREAIDQHEEGTLSLTSIGKEIYADGLGLFYFEKTFENGFSIKYQLSARYPMEVLEQKFLELHPEALE